MKRIRLFIYENALPFSIVENNSFRNLFSCKLMSVESFHKHMKEDFQILLNEIQHEINRAHKIAIVLDEWSSFNNSFL